MTYGTIYEAVSDTYYSPSAWSEEVVAGEPESLNLAEEVLGRHAPSPKTALRIRDFDTGVSETYSFSELDQRTNQVANFLEANMDPGEQLGILLEPRLELYASLFGAIKSHRLFLVLDTKFGPDALNYRLRTADVTTLITTADQLETVDPERVPTLARIVALDPLAEQSLDLEIISFDTIDTESTDYAAIRMHPSERYGTGFTSGTTGQPSQMTYRQGSLLGANSFRKFVIDFEPDDVYFVAASPAWSYGLAGGTLTPGLYGINIGAYRGPFDVERWLETLELWEVTNAMVPPTALRQLRASDVDVLAFDTTLRNLVTAGETLDAETSRWVADRFDTPPLDVYGLSEGGILLSNYPFPDWTIKHGSMGKPLPGADVRLVDPAASAEAPVEDPAPAEELSFINDTGTVGEIARYLQGGTGPLAGTGPTGWMRTGDLAKVDQDGYWWYRGRRDEVIISAGYKIGPQEVESTVIKHPAVKEVAVVGAPDDTRGEIVKAFVTVTDTAEPSADLEDDIISFSRTQLSKHEYPREVEIVMELPKTTVGGKLQRQRLDTE